MKTGLTIAAGGAVERFGVVPDIVCLAKALGGGVPCGAIGGTAEVMQVVVDGTYDQVGTFNGNPLTMAAMKAVLLEMLTPAAYRHFDELREELVERVRHTLGRHRIPGYVSAFGAKGAVVFSPTRIRNYRDFCALRLALRPRPLAVPAQRRRVPSAVGEGGAVDAVGAAHAADVDVAARNVERFARDLRG